MSLGEILDRTFQIYRSRFAAFVAIASVSVVIVNVIYFVTYRWEQTHWSNAQQASLSAVLIWVGLYQIAGFIHICVMPANVCMASSVILGEECSLLTSLRFLMARWRSFLWLAILRMFAVMVIPEMLIAGLIVGIGIVAVISGSMHSGAHALLVFAVPVALGVTLFLWLGSCLALAVPISAVEVDGGFKALRRSWVLTRNSRGRVLSIWMFVWVFGWAMTYGVQILFRWIVLSAFYDHHFGKISTAVYLLVAYLLNAVVSAAIGPIYPIAVTLIYYDQRIRHEGFDIEFMMNAAGLNAPVSLPAEDVPVGASTAGGV